MAPGCPRNAFWGREATWPVLVLKRGRGPGVGLAWAGGLPRDQVIDRCLGGFPDAGADDRLFVDGVGFPVRAVGRPVLEVPVERDRLDVVCLGRASSGQE